MARTRELRPIHVIVQGKHMDVTPALRDYAETKVGKIDRIEREIQLIGALDEQQRNRLLEIADKCPVHRTLRSEVDIRTKEV